MLSIDGATEPTGIGPTADGRPPPPPEGRQSPGGWQSPEGRAAVVVVDHDAGAVLGDCVRSLLDQAPDRVVVVENGDAVGARALLAGRRLAVPVVATGRNLGYGAGANRGVAASGTSEYVLIANADLRVHRRALASLVEALEAEPSWAIVGPRILTTAAEAYPSVRRFPSMGDAAGHALLGFFRPDNRFSNRYRPAVPEGDARVGADWVSGACLLVRRRAFEELGGFDETYFMFAEDLDLCWRAHEAGWGVGFQPTAVVTHEQGVSTRRHPYRMLAAHHRSAFRFAARSTRGWRRVALPGAALVLGARLAAACTQQALAR